MSIKDAIAILGRQTRDNLRRQVLALSLHSFSNTAEEARRLAAAKLVLKHWEIYRVLCQDSHRHRA